MTDAMQTLPIGDGGLGGVIVLYAHQDLKASHGSSAAKHGPWVRLYMDGLEGPARGGVLASPAMSSNKRATPSAPRCPCSHHSRSTTWRIARSSGEFFSRAVQISIIPSLRRAPFSKPSDPDGLVHTGIVTHVDDESFQTIEGNTNEGGGEEGYEVAQRVRPYGARDFLLIH